MKNIVKFIIALSVFTAGICYASLDLNMRPGVTSISRHIFDLHMFAIWVCVGIGVVVYGVMIYSILYHRKSKGAKAAHFHENVKLEIFWTIIPFILLIILAIPATSVLSKMEDTKNSDLTIKITGYQWKWQYQYMDEGLQFFSNLSTPIQQIFDENKKKDHWYLLEVDNPLVVPVHKKIRFLVTSNDVIHSWWVPELGVKRDAVPGFIHEAWAKIDKPGIYRGQCAELCGVNHGFMPIVVKAVSEKDFQEWSQQEKMREMLTPKTSSESAPVVESQPEAKPLKELMKEGEMQYGKYCAVCHRQDGLGMPPVFPALKGSSVATGKPISRHIQIVLTGVPGTAMQAFENQLTNDELAAIVTYERNAWENNTGDTVQAQDVEAVRQNLNSAPVTVKEKH